MCLDTAASDMSNGRARSVTLLTAKQAANDRPPSVARQRAVGRVQRSGMFNHQVEYSAPGHVESSLDEADHVLAARRRRNDGVAINAHDQRFG